MTSELQKALAFKYMTEEQARASYYREAKYKKEESKLRQWEIEEYANVMYRTPLLDLYKMRHWWRGDSEREAIRSVLYYRLWHPLFFVVIPFLVAMEILVCVSLK